MFLVAIAAGSAAALMRLPFAAKSKQALLVIRPHFPRSKVASRNSINRMALFVQAVAEDPEPCQTDRAAAFHYGWAKTTKQGTFRGINKSKTGHRIELYSAAYELALEQIPPLQMRERRICLCAFMLLLDANLRRERRTPTVSLSRHSKMSMLHQRNESSEAAIYEWFSPTLRISRRHGSAILRKMRTSGQHRKQKLIERYGAAAPAATRTLVGT
jgi:hypothetical protein